MAAAGAIVGINGRDPARAGEIAAAIPSAFAAPFDITDLPRRGGGHRRDRGPARSPRLPRQQCSGARPAGASRYYRRGFPPRARDQSGGPVRAVSRGRAAHDGARPGATRLRLLDGGRTVVPGRSGLRRVEGRTRGPRARARGGARPEGHRRQRDRARLLPDGGERRAVHQPHIVELGRRIPLQRFGQPEELVGAAIFLASDAASYITGQVLTVDAGLSSPCRRGRGAPPRGGTS